MPAKTLAVREFELDGALLALVDDPVAQSTVLMVHAAAANVGRASGEIVIARHCENCGSHQHGRPYVVGDPSCGLSFSRSANYAIAATRSASRVGVDIESVRAVASHPVNEVLLSEQERGWVATLDPDAAARAIAQFWVAKEALTKLVGTGLRTDLTRIELRLRGDTAALASPIGELGLTAAPSVTLFDVDDDVVGALATS